MLELKFYLVSALVMAAAWSLPAAGVSLIYAVQRYPNFALAEFMTLGAYLGVAGATVFGLPFWLAALVALAVCGILAAAIDQSVFRLVRHAGILPPILLSLGLMLLMQNFVRYLWGNGVQDFGLPLQRPLRFAGFIVTPTQAVSIAIAITVLIGLHVVLTRTAFGRDVRAIANNPELALASGVDPERVQTGILFIVGALAGLGGILLGLEASITPLLGWHSLLPIFAIAILGGLGHLVGTALAALMLALASEYSLLALPASYKSGIAFVVLAFVLLLRPQGLFGGRN